MAEAQPPPCEKRVRAARKAAQPKAHHAIVKSPPTDIAKHCYDCPEVGTWTHACWHPGNPPPIQIPSDQLQARLGWPRVDENSQNSLNREYNGQVLSCMVTTRTYLVTKSYDTVEQQTAPHAMPGLNMCFLERCACQHVAPQRKRVASQCHAPVCLD